MITKERNTVTASAVAAREFFVPAIVSLAILASAVSLVPNIVHADCNPGHPDCPIDNGNYGDDWYWEPDTVTYDNYGYYDSGDSWGDDWYWEPDYLTYDNYGYYEPNDDWYWEPDYVTYDNYGYYEPYYDDCYYGCGGGYYDSGFNIDIVYEHEEYDYEYDYDYCSYIPGHQSYGYDCYNHGDACKNIPGNQPQDYDCYPDHDDDEPRCELDADDTSIEEGDSVRLEWESDDADYATLSSFGSVSLDGSRTVYPTSDKTYTLTVRDNDGDEDTCSVRIEVEEEDDDDAEPWCDLSVDDSSVEEGDEVTLEWDTRNAEYASINQGIGRVDEDGGEEDVEIEDDDDVTFRMTVRNDDGDEDTCSVTVRVDDDNSFSSIDFDSGPVKNPPVVYLSDLPYTGIEDITPSMIGMFATLAALLAIGGYYVFLRREKVRA